MERVVYHLCTWQITHLSPDEVIKGVVFCIGTAYALERTFYENVICDWILRMYVIPSRLDKCLEWMSTKIRRIRAWNLNCKKLPSFRGIPIYIQLHWYMEMQRWMDDWLHGQLACIVWRDVTLDATFVRRWTTAAERWPRRFCLRCDLEGEWLWLLWVCLLGILVWRRQDARAI